MLVCFCFLIKMVNSISYYAVVISSQNFQDNKLYDVLILDDENSIDFILSSFVCSCAHMYATYNILWVRFHLCPDPSPPLAFRSRVLVPGHVYVRKNSFEFSTCLFKLSKLQGKQQRSINYTSLTFCSTPSPALAADCTYTRDGE